MPDSPPLKPAMSVSDDDDGDYMSAASHVLPSPPQARLSPSLSQQQGGSVPTGVTVSVASLKPSPPKLALNNRAVTAAGPGQKPHMPKRNRSVGFVEDLKITESPSTSSKGSVLPRPGIISQRKPSTDGASHASQRSNISSVSGSTHVKSNYSLDEIISSQFENEAVTHILAVLENEELREMDKLDSMKKGGSEYSSALLGERIDEQGESDGSDASSEEAGMTNYSEDEDEDNGGIPPPPPPPRDSGSLSSSPSTYSAPSHVRNDSFLQRVHMQNDQPQYQYDPYSPGSRSEWSSPGRKKSNRYGISSAGKSSAYLSYVTDDSALAEDAKSKGSITSGVSIERELTVENKGKHNNESIHNSSRIRVQHNADNDWDGYQGQSSLTSDKAKKAEDAHDTATLADRLRSLQLKRSNFSGRLSFQSSNASAASSVAAGALGAEPKSNTDKLLDALSRADQTKNQQWLRQLRLEYDHLIAPKIPTLEKSISHTLFFIIFPCLAVSAILFYLVDNPMIGDSNTSWSWLVLFLGVRQMVIFEFARVGEIFWIEILALRSSFFNMVVGPYLALAVIQSRGWPYICIFWPVLNFCFLYGNHEFAKHWLFWQDMLDIFNEVNPVDGVTDDNFYFRLLMVMIFIGVTVSLKRLTIALYLGRRTVEHFGVELEKLMAKMILIGEVSNLARDIEGRNSIFEVPMSPLNDEIDDAKIVRFREFVQSNDISDIDSPGKPRNTTRKSLSGPNNASQPAPSPPSPPVQTESSNMDPPSKPPLAHRDSSAESSRKSRTHPTRSLSSSSDDDNRRDMSTSSTSANLIYLLSEWNEPEILMQKNTKASVQDLLQFRRAVSYMDDRYPFSHAFGPSKTRQMCVESSQKVYDRLMLSTEDGTTSLPFSVFTVLATDNSGNLVESKMKSLIRLFRPDRDGSLTKLDFIKSIDTVYKELRLLRASIANSAQIDYAFEHVVNFFFYFFLIVASVLILGFNLWSVIIAMNGFLFSFSFSFGAAASNWFEGLLLIFVRRAYDIGDRIATSHPASDTSPSGSSTWFVERITLFTTTVRFATTNEVATYSNGSLASLRIINANRSPKAIIYIDIKFGLEVPFAKIKIFQTAVENFVKSRPREWVALIGFRATRVEVDFGYIEYRILSQHREAWQNIGPILQSKADLASFCLEVTKKLGMRYESPPMPVTVSTSGTNFRGLLTDGEDDIDNVDQEGADQMGFNKSMSAADLQDVAALFEVRND